MADRKKVPEWLLQSLLMIYGVFLAPELARATSGALYSHVPNVLLGSLLVLGLLLEAPFIIGKKALVQERQGYRSGPWFLLILLNILVNFTLTMIAVGFLGADPRAQDSIIPGLVGLFVTLRALILMAAGADPTEREKPSRGLLARIPEWLYDSFFLVYFCLAWTALWDGLLFPLGLEWQGPATLVPMVATGLVFLLFYSGLRIPAWLEFWAESDPGKKRSFLVGLALLMVGAVLGVYFLPTQG